MAKKGTIQFGFETPWLGRAVEKLPEQLICFIYIYSKSTLVVK